MYCTPDRGLTEIRIRLGDRCLRCIEAGWAGIIKIVSVVAHKRFLRIASGRNGISFILTQPKGIDMSKIILKLLEKISNLIVTLENNKFGALVFLAVFGLSALMKSNGSY